jgi:hypothetical protein
MSADANSVFFGHFGCPACLGKCTRHPYLLDIYDPKPAGNVNRLFLLIRALDLTFQLHTSVTFPPVTNRILNPLSIESRVTILGEFSPIGRLFTLSIFV